ncbi:MAG: hypothetical protein IPM27_11995 [Nitrosomonadales bacterium]|nr:hypothetical protein [Nitrosomonadales bacterium]
MATIEQRITTLESRRKPEVVKMQKPRPSVSESEWMELQQKTDFQTAEYPRLFAEILARRGDGSEIKHSDYIRKLEKQYGNA